MAPHISWEGCSPEQQAGRSGRPKIRQRLSGASWTQRWQATEQLIREGKIAYVGSSNSAGWDIATVQCTAASRNMLGLASERSLIFGRFHMFAATLL